MVNQLITETRECNQVLLTELRQIDAEHQLARSTASEQQCEEMKDLQELETERDSCKTEFQEYHSVAKQEAEAVTAAHEQEMKDLQEQLQVQLQELETERDSCKRALLLERNEAARKTQQQQPREANTPGEQLKLMVSELQLAKEELAMRSSAQSGKDQNNVVRFIDLTKFDESRNDEIQRLEQEIGSTRKDESLDPLICKPVGTVNAGLDKLCSEECTAVKLDLRTKVAAAEAERDSAFVSNPHQWFLCMTRNFLCTGGER